MLNDTGAALDTLGTASNTMNNDTTGTLSSRLLQKNSCLLFYS